MLKPLAIAILSLSLSACIEDSKETTNEKLNFNSDVLGYTGVWDESSEMDGLVDEKYIVIRSDGTLVSYNYLGDSFDNDRNCYEKSNELTVKKIAENTFSLQAKNSSVNVNLEAKMLVTGNLLTMRIDDSASIMTRSDTPESDFTPLCN